MASTSLRTFAPALTCSAVDFPSLSGVTSFPRKEFRIKSASSSRVRGFVGAVPSLRSLSSLPPFFGFLFVSSFGPSAVPCPFMLDVSVSLLFDASNDSRASGVSCDMARPSDAADDRPLAATAGTDRDLFRLKPAAADRLKDFDADFCVFVIVVFCVAVAAAVASPPMASVRQCISYSVRLRTASADEDLVFASSSPLFELAAV
mmetsp:Transcript_464/g.1385  ORF Transcript_464/g.1385 Transcript_464/m.1385 type:complete len:204 (-) Transcript_464:441-1052(-)